MVIKIIKGQLNVYLRYLSLKFIISVLNTKCKNTNNKITPVTYLNVISYCQP